MEKWLLGLKDGTFSLLPSLSSSGAFSVIFFLHLNDLLAEAGGTMVTTEGGIFDFSTPKSPENAFSGIFTYLKSV